MSMNYIFGLLAVVLAFLPQHTFAQYGPAYNPYGTSATPQTYVQDDARCPVISQDLFRGLRDVYEGGDIYRLQTFLIREGFLPADSATGLFGPLTARAVSMFQQNVGIYPASGRFGPLTRSRVAARCGGAVPPSYQCPAIPMAYPVCQGGVQAVATKDYRGCVTGYSCPTYGYGTTPTISSFSGPTTLNLGQQGTWSVAASDPNNQQLTYSILWGDEASYGTYTLAAPGYAQTVVSQGTTYTHTYSMPGTYTVRITAKNVAGYTSTATATVVVGSYYGNTSLRVTAPTASQTLYTGTTLPISWTDVNTYFAAQRYDIRVVPVTSTCAGTPCPTTTYIATGVYGQYYSWGVPTGFTPGVYYVEVCPAGSTTCSRSDAQVSILTNATSYYPTATLTISPYSGSIPMTSTATIVLGFDPNGYSACGTQTYGTLEWGDGAVDTVTYLGCSGTTATATYSHTYTTAGTYTARLVRNGQTATSLTVYAGGSSSTGAITSVNVGQSSVARGGQVTTTYTVANPPSNTSLGLELIDATSGTTYGYMALGQAAASGAYTWTVPTYSSSVIADSPYVQGSSQIDGKTVYVRAKLYTPSNACFGYCSSAYLPTFVSTMNSGTFMIGSGSSGTLSPSFTVAATGSRYVTVTTNTPLSGTTCGMNGSLVLDFGDGMALPISTTYTGTSSCSSETKTYTYQYATVGTKTISIRNNTYPYQIYTTRSVTVN